MSKANQLGNSDGERDIIPITCAPADADEGAAAEVTGHINEAAMTIDEQTANALFGDIPVRMQSEAQRATSEPKQPSVVSMNDVICHHADPSNLSPEDRKIWVAGDANRNELTDETEIALWNERHPAA